MSSFLSFGHGSPNKRSKVSLVYDEATNNGGGKREGKNMKITELLERNLSEHINSGENDQHKLRNNQDKKRLRTVEGDVPALALRHEFFMGVKLGWPFPVMLKPQRLMAMHIIKGLSTSKHVVLESPTGTGKSAAILCSALAWQRHHYNATGEKVKIIYCSRTHSQVAQMVSSLQKTPYRPSMTVLGSRNHMCIHENLPQHANITNECRSRVKATEGARKSSREYVTHTDDNPPTWLESDDFEEPTKDSSDGREKKPTCPHYRQLGATRTADNIARSFRPSLRAIAHGDESTKEGTHDIEDLVQFGRNPYKRTVVLNKQPVETWGMTFTTSTQSQFPRVHAVHPGGRVEKSATVKVGDMIFSINGTSTAHRTMDDLAGACRNSKEKLVLQTGTAHEVVHPHSSCPYYMSRALEKHAELIFCPYNYVLDPNIRKALSIGIEGAIVVLDEAHNVEDTLRDSGSGTWSEIDLCSMVMALQYYANATNDYAGKAKLNNSGSGAEEVEVTEMAHELLVFLEKIVLFMLDNKRVFEEDGGARKALAECERFNTPDTKAFETSYYGPTGHGLLNRQVGCAKFFDTIRVGTGKAVLLRRYAEAMMENIAGRDKNFEVNTFETMVDVVTKLTLAMEDPQHYFVQSTVQANGSFEFASGGMISQRSRQRNPKALPKASDNSSCRFCRDMKCGHELVFKDGAVRHGSYNTGAKPPWESFLVLELLSPARFMKDLAAGCRSVILASGSLAPLPSLCAELGLMASSDTPHTPAESNATSAPRLTPGDLVKAVVEEDPKAEPPGRLQDRPPPLEADHVVDLQKQLLAVSIGHFPNGEKLTVNYSQYTREDFCTNLGGAIAQVIECIPRGGVLVFLPSYSLLRKCTRAWNPESSYVQNSAFDSSPPGTWGRFLKSKGKVIVEPTGSQSDFEAARDEYAATIRSTGSCILLAVFRGKMSEGISFNDDNARGVICVGIPFPNSFDRCITAKKNYNDEQRKIGKRLDVLDGNSWYSQQAFRAIAQALGRCIRHAGDYGTVILMDSRHCDESPPDQHGVCMAHSKLPKWMRSHVKSLTPRAIHDPDSKLIGGGWEGLKATMKTFFEEAPRHCSEVLIHQREQLLEAQKRATGALASTSPQSGAGLVMLASH